MIKTLQDNLLKRPQVYKYIFLKKMYTIFVKLEYSHQEKHWTFFLKK